MSVILKIGDYIVPNEVISVSENASTLVGDRDNSSLFGGKDHLNIDLKDTNPSSINISTLRERINHDSTFIICDKKSGEEVIRYTEYDFIGTLSKQVVSGDKGVNIVISIIMYRTIDMNIKEEN